MQMQTEPPSCTNSCPAKARPHPATGRLSRQTGPTQETLTCRGSPPAPLGFRGRGCLFCLILCWYSVQHCIQGGLIGQQRPLGPQHLREVPGHLIIAEGLTMVTHTQHFSSTSPTFTLVSHITRDVAVARRRAFLPFEGTEKLQVTKMSGKAWGSALAPGP